MSVYLPIRDITRGNGKPLDEADPDLVVLNVEHGKSFKALNTNASKPGDAAAAADEQLKGRLKIDFKSSLKLLEDTGWGNGTRLPFANKENHELEKILEIKQRKYLVVQTELRDNDEHLQLLEQNFVRASEDILTFHNFLSSKKKQIEEERNLVYLADRFYNRVVLDSKQTAKALKDCQERCDRMQTNQERRLKNLTELRNLIEFDREALQEYHQRLKNYQNQKLELGRIIHEDSKTVEHIDNMYVELGAKRKILKMELDQQAMNSAKCQEQLDRLSMEFRKVYKHRQEMITLWSTNIENAKRKDAQMQEVADDYFEVRERIRELNNEMDFRERQYRNIQCGISRAQLQISELDKKLGEIRNVLRNSKDYGVQLNDSILELQQDIRATSTEEKNLHAKMAKLDTEMAGQHERLEKIRAVVKKLRQKLNDVMNLRYDSDENINELEKILSDETKRGENVLREMELVRKFFWERSNDKKTVVQDILHAEMALHRLKGSLANMEAKEFANMEFLAKQSAKVYRLDLENSTLENKVSRAENEAINPQYYLLQTEVTQLRDMGKKLDEERHYITKELSYLEHLISKSGSELAKNKEEKSKLSTELLQINMVSQRTQKLIDEADKKIQDTQVENSLESVNLKRLNDSIKLAKEQIFGLSEERKTIYWAVHERKSEIENNRMLNSSKSKALMEAVGKLRVQIHEMEGRTQKLKGRFDLLTKLMLGSQSSGSDDETIGQKVRQAARERESLQVELRKWEARVEDAKQELAGLENVLQILHASNLAVKEKLSPITDGSTESQELEILEQEEKAIHVRKNRAARFKAVLFDKLEDLKQQIAVMDQETQATAQLCKMKDQMASKIENEIHRQKEKVQRWNTLCCKLLKEVKPIIKKEDYEILQKDFKLRFTQEKLECSFTMVDRLVTAFPQLKQTVVEHFENDKYLYALAYRLLKPSVASTSFANRALSTSSALRHSSIRYAEPEPISTTSSSRSKSNKKSAYGSGYGSGTNSGDENEKSQISVSELENDITEELEKFENLQRKKRATRVSKS